MKIIDVFSLLKIYIIELGCVYFWTSGVGIGMFSVIGDKKCRPVL